jgi:hypothetical protein
MRTPVAAFALFVALFLPFPAAAQTTVGTTLGTTVGTTLEESVPPGRNFDKAEFKLWLPSDVAPVQAIAVLVPGSNGDGRGQVDDPIWREFATRHKLALIGVRLTDKPHEQGFIEEYVNVSQGSGQALLDAVNAFAARAKHPELATAPFLLWGMSAGGEFNYEFVQAIGDAPAPNYPTAWLPTARVAERWQ